MPVITRTGMATITGTTMNTSNITIMGVRPTNIRTTMERARRVRTCQA